VTVAEIEQLELRTSLVWWLRYHGGCVRHAADQPFLKAVWKTRPEGARTAGLGACPSLAVALERVAAELEPTR
jgi:hypothetical protein